jgi:hypothetical protein
MDKKQLYYNILYVPVGKYFRMQSHDSNIGISSVCDRVWDTVNML